MAAVSTMSKKRYQEFSDVLLTKVQDHELANELLRDLCEILNFDPDKSRYTPELGQKIIAHRHKLRDEQGISTYVSSGRKKNYEKSRAISAQ